MDRLRINNIDNNFSGLQFCNTGIDLEKIRYYNSESIREANYILSEFQGEAKILAGGVDLISLVKNRIIIPRALVNIKNIQDLNYVKEDSEGLKIGALTTINNIKNSTLIAEKYQLLHQAAVCIAAPQIRNMATIGGNLCQHVRCWYYRRPLGTGLCFQCWRKGGSECFAQKGDNRFHAIIENNVCNAVHPSDMATALSVLGSKISISGFSGERIINLDQLYTNLGYAIKNDEIITEVQIPKIDSNTRTKFLKFRFRKAIDFAVVNVAIFLQFNVKIVSSVKIVFGGIAPFPYRAISAEKLLIGNSITEGLADEAAESVLRDATPSTMNSYKVSIATALLKRALLG